MGLDYAEVLLAIEEEFLIEIPENDAQNFVTVKDVVDCVEGRIRENEVPAWKGKEILLDKTSNLRDELATALGVSREEIPADAPLEKLIPRRMRKNLWENSPQLACTGKLRRSCMQFLFFFVLVIAGFYFFLALANGAGIGVVPGLVLWGIFLLAFYRIFRDRKTVFPFSGSTTITDVARILIAKEGIRINRNGEPWTREQIESRIVEMIAEVAGIQKPEQITLESRLVDDIALG